MSKHSISSKEKIIFNGIDKPKVKPAKINYFSNKNTSRQVKPNNKEIVEIGKLREKKSIVKNPNTIKH